MAGKNTHTPTSDNDASKGIERWYGMEKKETGSVILIYFILKTRPGKIGQKVNISYI